MFIETIDALIDSLDSLSTIEKILYLTGDSEGPATDHVWGLSSKYFEEPRKKNDLEMCKL